MNRRPHLPVPPAAWLARFACVCARVAPGATARAATPHPGFTVAEREGTIVVADVFEDTLAAVLDVRPGDVVARVSNQPVTPQVLRRAITTRRVGATVRVTVLRDGQPRELQVPLVDAEKPATWAAAAAATARRLDGEFRRAMDEFAARHGPVRMLDGRFIAAADAVSRHAADLAHRPVGHAAPAGT